jgi:hypothetical protein
LSEHLTEQELDNLIARAPASLQRDISRLCAEVKDLRAEAASREFFEQQEQVN